MIELSLAALAGVYFGVLGALGTIALLLYWLDPSI